MRVAASVRERGDYQRLAIMWIVEDFERVRMAMMWIVDDDERVTMMRGKAFESGSLCERER